MDPLDFVKTIYLGDRFCKSIVLDGYNNRVKIQVNVLSRVRDSSGLWNFYTDEDIEDGFIVLSGVDSFIIEPMGHIPNDYIELEASILDNNSPEEDKKYVFTFYTGYVNASVNTSQVIIKVVAKAISLENPLHPDAQIT